ncbi:MAG: diacylglycerol/lipid kinase family protein, partial [Myxococcaceae bacterium]
MSVAVLINRRARRGSQKLAQLASRILPRARVALTSSLEECRAWLKELRADPPQLLLAGGGDGTTATLLNELAEGQMPFPLIGVLPMGTGNAWAHVTGAPKAEKALERIAALNGKRPPMRTFGLVRVNGGTLAPFAGTGFDADLVNDYKAQLQLYPPGPLREAHTGLRGYLGALFTRTIPRHVFGAGPAHVKVTNLGGAALTLDARGNVVKLVGGETGAVLFEGL